MAQTHLSRAQRELRELLEALERLERAVDTRLMGYQEVARVTGIGRAALRKRHERGLLPTPIDVIAAGPIWFAADIEDWLERQQETFD